MFVNEAPALPTGGGMTLHERRCRRPPEIAVSAIVAPAIVVHRLERAGESRDATGRRALASEIAVRTPDERPCVARIPKMTRSRRRALSIPFSKVGAKPAATTPAVAPPEIRERPAVRRWAPQTARWQRVRRRAMCPALRG